MSKPLDGIRVVEFSTYVAGPVTARLLADMGAEVIKVERPEGDDWREVGIGYNLKKYSHEDNPVFNIYNSGKKHLALNLKTDEGMEAFHRLLGTADVLITNTRMAALKRLKLTYEDLKEKYPKLVYGIILGYGEEGPDAQLPAFDTSAYWARSGFLLGQSVLGEDYRPVYPPYSMGDTTTGYLLMGQICAALLRKEKTGKGDYVKAGLYHNSIFSVGTMAILSQEPNDVKFPRERSEWGTISGDHLCGDGQWVFISGYSGKLQSRMYKMLGLESIHDDPRFSDEESIQKNQKAYSSIIEQAFLSKPSTYWIEKAREVDVPLTRMNQYSDLAQDPQARLNGYIEAVVSPNGHVNVMPSSPIEMESVGELVTKCAPAVGADSQVILSELGYTAEQIKAMTDSGGVK